MAFGIVSTGGNVVEVNGGTGTVTANVWELARIRWVSSGASAGDTCKITDTAGNVWFESEATGADWSDEVEVSKTQTMNGVKVATLGSGNIYFYLR
jgi:hypothetical protein